MLTSYDQAHIAQIALPLGGIGTGTVSLGGRGDLRDWEVVNRSSKGFQPKSTFFALYTKAEDGPAQTRLLEGPLSPPFDVDTRYRGFARGMPRFRNATFDAAYPLGQIHLSDRTMPLDVRIEG